MVAKDIITLTTLREGKTIYNGLFFVDAGTPVEEVEKNIRLAILDYLSTDEGTQEAQMSCEDFNWGDAFNSVTNEFYEAYGISELSGKQVLLSGSQDSIEVDHDEILLKASYPTVVKKYDTVSITKLFANKEDETYGDVYSQKWDYLVNYDEEDMLIGYSVYDPKTGFILDGAADFYETMEEAEAFALSIGAKPVVNVFELEGGELFDHVFPEEEVVIVVSGDEETDEEYEDSSQPESIYCIEDVEGVTNFEVRSEGVNGWYETKVATFKKDGQFYEIKEEFHTSDNVYDSELLYNTMRAIR